ncbi:MAG: 2,3-bisphosphoglycerate-independent phosphoglycerate mutase [Candidatus Dojkabacteria bacterium]
MDGLGVDPVEEGNAVLLAKTPFLDTVWTKGFSTLIQASGINVGLPDGEPGNSEVGHLNIGSGQVVYQSLSRINDSINSGKFYENPVIKEAFEEVKKRGSNLHFMGLLSTGGVHGHTDHLYALMEIAQKYKIDPFIHAFLDGRDTGLNDGYFFLSKLMEKIKQLGVGKLATLSGRLYSMDRDKRWERTQEAYDCMVGNANVRRAIDPFKAVQEAYANGENDQIFKPTILVDGKSQPLGSIKDNDVVIFYNFREDRARQITKAFVIKELDNLNRDNFPHNLHFVTMTGYEEGLPVKVVYPPKPIDRSMAHILSERGMKQLHISETEKYMHVTYFFNGGVEDPFEGEDRMNIPSPRVFDYAETPQMSAEIIADEAVYRLTRQDKLNYSFIVINFANPDMLGHTGNLDAAIKGVEYTDKCVARVVKKTVEKGGAAIIIADHGNCEIMIDHETGKPHTFHTTNPVPFIVVSEKEQCVADKDEKLLRIGTGERAVASGILADVIPTALSMLGIEQAQTMTGVNLLEVL